jgi:hypothetical protein
LRLELGLLATGLLCWLASLILGEVGPPEGGLLPIDLYPLYSVAAVLGWLAGNGFVLRSRGRGRERRRLLWMAYLLAPPGFFFLLWTLAPAGVRTAAPLAPVWAWGVFLVLFLVPVTFRRRT